MICIDANTTLIETKPRNSPLGKHQRCLRRKCIPSTIHLNIDLHLSIIEIILQIFNMDVYTAQSSSIYDLLPIPTAVKRRVPRALKRSISWASKSSLYRLSTGSSDSVIETPPPSYRSRNTSSSNISDATSLSMSSRETCTSRPSSASSDTLFSRVDEASGVNWKYAEQGTLDVDMLRELKSLTNVQGVLFSIIRDWNRFLSKRHLPSLLVFSLVSNTYTPPHTFSEAFRWI